MRFHLVYFAMLLLALQSCEEKEELMGEPAETWVFIMAGQSNMAGRGEIEREDKEINYRVFAIDSNDRVGFAKAPIHFYEPNIAGLDCGLSFGNAITEATEEHINVLLIPAAVGNSSIQDWIGNKRVRDVLLMTNFLDKVAIGKSRGSIKGILWHQGESDAIELEKADVYQDKLGTLFSLFRDAVGNQKLPIIMGELGSFSKDPFWAEINEKMHAYAGSDPYSSVIMTTDLTHKGDSVHFDSESLRSMGSRYAQEYFKY